MSNIDKNYEDFLNSLQEDNSQNSQEAFPFSEDFDIENFIKTTEAPAQTQVQPKTPETVQDNSAQITNANTQNNNDLTTVSEDKKVTFDQNEDKNYSLKRLEEKLSDLQQKFNETNAAKEEESVFAAELKKEDEYEAAEPVKSDEEFFSNISSAIHTLKGSLDSIVNTRLRYEENLIRQDQTLIARLREKTTRLKAINLALNSEVKRAKSEKLEYLRRSAEQTKELLALRMQLSHAEERSKQGDFKISNLEQQITLLTQEKSLLDEEIAKIRQEKLTYLQNSAEQTRNIMELRHQLAAKEEALKQEEIKTNFLDQQLKTVETEYQALKQQTPDSEIQKTLRLQKEEIESLTLQLNQSRQELAKKTEEVTSLRQQLLSLQFAPEQSKNAAAAFAVKQEERLEPLIISQEDHERKIALLRAEQSSELQNLRTKALQEETALRGELQRAEAKYQQESTFVNTLKAQIKTLEENLAALEQESGGYKEKSETLAKELASIKENNEAELVNLKENLKRAQNSYEKQQEFYNTLETQYQNTQREKYYLGEELKKVISQKDNALLQNERYLSEIEKLKGNQNDINQDLKEEIQNLLTTRNQLQKEIENLKANASTPAVQLQQAQNSLQENNLALSLLKSELAALLNSKESTDKALLEAKQEKYKLLSKLAEQTEQLNSYQSKYQDEIASLAQEKEKAQTEAFTKINSLENKIKENEGYITSLITKIQELEQEKLNLAQQEENQKLAEELKNKTVENQKLAEEIKNKTINSQKAAEEIQTKNLEIQKLNQDLEKAKKIFSQDTVLLEELKTQYSKLQERTEILQTELAKVAEEKGQIEQERNSYKAQVEDLQHQLDSVKEELKQGQEFTKQLTEQVNKLKTVNAALNAAMALAQSQKIEALNKTAQQTQEILELKEQLKQAQTKFLEFEQGTVKLKEEYAAKIHELEEELKRVSAVCVAQTKEINEIKTDNERLKTVAEEKLLLQNRFNALQQNANLLSEELNTYKARSKNDVLIKAKTAALASQLDKVNKEKEELKVRLNATQAELKAATERELRTNQELTALHRALSENKETIAKLKAQIVPLMQSVAVYKASQTIRKEAVKPAASVQPAAPKTAPQAVKETPKPAAQVKPATPQVPSQKAAPMPAKKVNILEETSEDIGDDTFDDTQTAKTSPQPQKQAVQKSVAPAVQEKKTVAQKETKAPTQIDILADYEDENTNSANTENPIFNDKPNSQPLEEVNLPEQEMDLSAIFGDDVKPTAQPQQVATKPVNKVVVEEVKQTDVSQIMKQRIAKKQKVMDELKMTVDENAVTDHSIRRSVVSRHPHLRNPVTTLEKGQEYSDFLKKTKSMFYRIKWSLFKD
ncbi:MAG: hypothetical protein K6E94_05275 [Elusimicrobiaceae bacterium]|nr:hypothetical protein [Elusimicrobiaceae bacterium]